MDNYPLADSFDAIGEWFLPSDPDHKIVGRLSYSAGRTELHLNGNFQPLRGSVYVGDTQEYPLVYGAIRSGLPMSLIRVQRVGMFMQAGMSITGTQQSEHLITKSLIVGAHVSEDCACTELSCRIPGLNIWLSRKVVSLTFSANEEVREIESIYRVVNPPEEMTGVQTISTNVGWNVSVECKNAGDPFGISVSSTGWLRLHLDNRQPLTWYFDQISKLTTLLSFLSGSPMQPDCINITIDGLPGDAAVLAVSRDTTYCPYGNLKDFYMPRSALGTDFEGVVSKWFEIFDKVAVPSQLALSVMASDKLWSYVEFLSLMQALEGFHRAILEGVYMPPVDFEQVKLALVAAIPSNVGSDHKSSLCSRIRYANEISLAKRLKDLAERLCPPVRELIFGGSSIVPRQWIDTRNYYTHWDEELRQKILDGQGLLRANVRIRHFLRALYLDLAGVPQDTILRALYNYSHESQLLAQINAVERRRVNPADESGMVMTIFEQPVAAPVSQGPPDVDPDPQC